MESGREDDLDRMIDDLFVGRETISKDELRTVEPLNRFMYCIVRLKEGELTKDEVKRELIGRTSDPEAGDPIPPRHGREESPGQTD